MQRAMNKLTTEAIRAERTSAVAPEFGRCEDLRLLFGLKRGTAYNLLAEGKIHGVLLRVKGKKSGIRLFDLESVRQFIRSQMEPTAVNIRTRKTDTFDRSATLCFHENDKEQFVNNSQ